MKRFVFKITIFLVLLFVVDRLLFFPKNISQTNQYDKRLEALISGNIQTELLVIGSSRAARNIIAGQIEDSTMISSFNLGFPGSDIDFHVFVLKKAINFNKNLRHVILVIDNPEELIQSQSLRFRLDVLYPLVNIPEINDELIFRNENHLLSKYMYSLRLRRTNLSFNKEPGANDTILKCGSMPISYQRKGRKWDRLEEEIDYEIKNEVVQKKNRLEEFITLCKINDIDLFIVSPPNYSNLNSAFESRIKQLISPHKEVTYYLYDTSNTTYSNILYYYDEAHLKTNGAIVFTNEIIKFINPIISSKSNHTHQGTN
jgi:hypothetical protein